MKITIIGTGYVGLVTGACFAEMGNIVSCVDIDKKKIINLTKGIIPIYEPGLEEIIYRNKDDNRISFSNSLLGHLNEVDVIFIAVGTPQDEVGNANMEYVYAAAKDIGKNLNENAIVVNKSTVPVGTAEKVKSIIVKELDARGKDISVQVVSNPEFLKEGDAIQDFMRPDRVVIGTDDDTALGIMKQLYSPFTMNHDRLIHMGVKEAELTKYAANAMLATKISFINEIAYICDELGIDIEDVRRGVGSDSRIGYSFIYPGVGYGGSCFPKDIQALIHTAKDAGIDPMLLNAIQERNNFQKERLLSYIKDVFGSNLNNKIFTIWGLSFKPGTDDMREAPSINVINSIINAGGIVQAFDPVSSDEARKKFPIDWFETKKLALYDDNYSALDNSNALILLTEWKMFRNPDIKKMKSRMKKLCIFDGRNQYDPLFMKKNGFMYKGIGR